MKARPVSKYYLKTYTDLTDEQIESFCSALTNEILRTRQLLFVQNDEEVIYITPDSEKDIKKANFIADFMNTYNESEVSEF